MFPIQKGKSHTVSLNTFSLFYVYSVLTACVSVYHVWAWHLKQSKASIRPSGNGVVDGVSHHMAAGNLTWRSRSSGGEAHALSMSQHMSAWNLT